MNPTDEFLIDAFKQQNLLSDEMWADVVAEVDQQPKTKLLTRISPIMDGLLERIGLPKEEVVNF